MKDSINLIFSNFKEVFGKINYIILLLVVFFLLMSFFFIQSNYEMTKGNYGEYYLYLLIFSQIAISFLFALFISASIYKYKKFSVFSPKESSTGFFGAIIGSIFAGCGACTVTFASYLGLAGLLSFLPYDGLEIKLLSVLILIYASWYTLKNLNVCGFSKIKKKNKIKS